MEGIYADQDFTIRFDNAPEFDCGGVSTDGVLEFESFQANNEEYFRVLQRATHEKAQLSAEVSEELRAKTLNASRMIDIHLYFLEKPKEITYTTWNVYLDVACTMPKYC